MSTDYDQFPFGKLCDQGAILWLSWSGKQIYKFWVVCTPPASSTEWLRGQHGAHLVCGRTVIVSRGSRGQGRGLRGCTVVVTKCQYKCWGFHLDCKYIRAPCGVLFGPWIRGPVYRRFTFLWPVSLVSCLQGLVHCTEDWIRSAGGCNGLCRHYPWPVDTRGSSLAPRTGCVPLVDAIRG
jgi:hypothetical protein